MVKKNREEEERGMEECMDEGRKEGRKEGREERLNISPVAYLCTP